LNFTIVITNLSLSIFLGLGLWCLTPLSNSKQGTELLQAGHLTSAVKAFKYAYKYAGDMDDEYMERACAFNLGAAYIATWNVTEKRIVILT
jgi:hypothetical protein